MYCFILYISLAALITPGPGMTLPMDSVSDEMQKPVVLPIKSLKNAAEIMQLLKFMNKGNVENKSLQRQKSEPGIDIDYLGVSVEKGDIVNELMDMIKKNYHTKEKQGHLPNDRLIYISNPEVLDEYKKQQKIKQGAVSSDSEGGARDDDDSNATNSFLEVLRHLRRFDQLKDQNNGDIEELELVTPEVSVETITMAKNEMDNQLNLRAGDQDKFDSAEDKFDPFPEQNEPFEAKHDAIDVKTTKFHTIKSSGEKPKKSENRFKDNDRWNDDYNSLKNRKQKKNPKSNPLLSKIQMQDNPPFAKFGSQPKSKAKRAKRQKQERPREIGGIHSYGRTPVPYVGKRGIYEEDE